MYLRIFFACVLTFSLVRSQCTTTCKDICIFIGDTSFGTKLTAQAIISSDPSNNQFITGTINFSQEQGGITVIYGDIEDLSDGNHGLHIDQNGNINLGCVNSGLHYNPSNELHGDVNATIRHVGDLGNIDSLHRKVKINITDSLI